ncbi:MAG TPA: alpha/beta fold hydrolase [Acidimicrobiales bacterium]|nr:alpha/beta fold hydrolase [Acidimicrobiales bacterium]
MSDGDRISEFTNDGFTFEVLDSGPVDGEVVVCLHGFPQPASSWAQVTERLTSSGFRVLAPTQRGYSPRARPTSRRAYTTGKLAGDIVALLDAVDADRMHVVGHDWGGGVAWQLAASHPDRCATLTSVSTPHPGAVVKSMTHSSQLLHSWYMLAFQIPWLPETLMAKVGPARAKDTFVKDGLSESAAQASAELLCDPEVARGMIGWYRALPFAGKEPIGKIAVPSVYLWSDGDHYLGRWAAEHTAEWVTGPYRFIEIPGGTHWLPDTHPMRIADAVTAIAAEYPASSDPAR